MYEVTCYDLCGNTINNFFQWDIDQQITIILEGLPDGYLTNAPEVHFANAKRTEAYVVRSTVDNNRVITASIPNILLQEAYPIFVYVYLTDETDVSSQKTILYSEIPVRKRQKPSDYLYVENIKRITAEDIKDEIEASTEAARTDAINSITTTKNNAITQVTNTKNTSIQRVEDERDSAVETIDKGRDEFLATGNNLVAQATQIKNNTQQTYENTVAVANSTKTTIETNIDVMITENGLSSKIVNDGEGNVTLSILINES